MSQSHLRRWWLLAAPIAAVLCWPLPASVGNAESVPPAQPTGLSVSQRATLAAVSWEAVPGATGYQVFLTSGNTIPREPTVSSAETVAVLSHLTPLTAYEVAVRAVGSEDSLGPLSGTTTFTTTEVPFSQLAPKLTVTSAVTSLTANWAGVGGNVSYEVGISTADDFSDEKTATVATTTTTFTSLAERTTYKLRARVLDADGSPASDWSSPVAASTDLGIRVGTYNLACAKCGGKAHPWSTRLPALVSTIRGQDLDVIGVQEALKGKVPGKSVRNYEDFANALGAPFQLTFSGALEGSGERILYNTDRVTLLKKGYQRLRSRDPRYVTWAVFRQNATEKEFLFVDTHLEPGKSKAKTRLAQLNTLLSVVRAQRGDRSVIAVGDFNSYKWMSDGNAAYKKMLAGGFTDPLGNSFKSTTSATDPTVEKRIHTNYNSFNNWNPVQSPKAGWINGLNIDYIFVSSPQLADAPEVRVAEYETVVDLDAGGRLTAPIPSDHNLLRATLLLPD